MTVRTFILDCPYCKAKVSAEKTGEASNRGREPETGELYASRLYVGKCPGCDALLAGESHQIAFENYGAYEDEWSDIVRVYPNPSKTFSSYRIPHVVKSSLAEADKCIQVGSYIASCAMLGRAVEALCRDILDPERGKIPVPGAKPDREKVQSRIMLGEGIRKLKEGGHIDQRIYDWSQHLHFFRNMAAHPDEEDISRQNAEDLQAFCYAIVEYVYDLADRYDDFKKRLEREAARKSV